MFKLITILLCTFYGLFLFPQKEANIWYFGEKAGVDFNSSSGLPVALNDGVMDAREGCSSIADENGDLLFYTDGVTVWNKNHQPMDNGTNLKGHWSSTQSAIIVPKPKSNSIFYVFTMGVKDNTPTGLNYTEVDMSLANGLGAVTNTKNIPLITETSERIAAVRHANGEDLWVVIHSWGSNPNTFHAFQVTSSGVNNTPVISSSGIVENQGQNVGQLKVSPNGKYLATAFTGNKFSLVGNFDNSTGVVSNLVTIALNPAISVYGIEFSPSSNFLYISSTNRDSLFQFDVTAADIPASVVAIENAMRLSSLQLGPDQKIYACQRYQPFLAVINEPNLKGNACNLVLDAVSLNDKNANQGLPNYISSFSYSIPEQDTTEVNGFYLPSAFTPNNDGVNDILSPFTEKILTDFNFQIFNRWGELIYQTSDINKGWDGKKNGKHLPVDTYVIKVHYASATGEKEELIKAIHLIR